MASFISAPWEGIRCAPGGLADSGREGDYRGAGTRSSTQSSRPGPRFLDSSLDLLPFTFYDSRIE